MIDHAVLVRLRLLDSGGPVFSLVGQNVQCGPLPEGANPELAPWITVNAEGGDAHPEIPITTARLQVRVWCGQFQRTLARTVYAAVHEWLHGKNSIELSPDGFILISQEVVLGQDLIDPDAGYATVLSYYQITARDSA